MPKNFGKSPVAKKFEEIAKNTMANANVAVIKIIQNSSLIDYPGNGEDISYTADLENSINELGFTDPVEVTDFNMPDGKYMIVSGHRRRAAGVKCGMDLFPCFVKSFESDDDVRNYVLLSNSQRDSAKDPLLYCNRFKLHENYLKNINFQGSVREEIAKRLGISVRQADRYNQMNKIISPVWDLIREERVGMSSVLPMADLAPEEQTEIFEILKNSLDEGTELTREKVNYIIKNYKNPDDSDDSDDSEIPGDFSDSQFESVKIKSPDTPKPGAGVMKSIKILNANLSRLRDFGDEKDAGNLLKAMEQTFELMLGKFYSISKRYELDEDVQKIMENLSDMIKDTKL